MGAGLAVLAGGLFLYAIASKRLGLTIFTGPLVFATLGWGLGAEGLGLVELPEGEGLANIEIVTVMLEATLVLVLFTDAMTLNTSRWRDEAGLPARLLGVGLPLTVLAGLGVALVLLDQLEFWEAALIAIILAPTDAALGQAVVSNPRVPQRIRQGLNVESGLNDGIALPVFFVFLEAAEAVEASLSFRSLLWDITREVLIAGVAGVAIAVAAVRLIGWTRQRDWIAHGWDQVALLGVAFGAWSVGNLLGGSGFISAWVAGLVVGRALRGRESGRRDFAEDTGHVLTLLSFFVFGAFLLGEAAAEMTWQAALYAVLSLTLIRIVPVALSLIGGGFAWPSVLYLGWFGPRGLASIILVATVVAESNLEGGPTIALVMTATVGLSIYAHGATALWGSNRYADWFESQRTGETAEGTEVPAVAVSRRLGHGHHRGGTS
jgi:NhaP-type Na+/H+ or K+/H+ antiporter